MNIDLEKLLELAKASTPGPWAVSAETPQFGDWSVRQDPADWNGSGYQLICSLPSAKKGGHYGEMFRANAHFIAAANPAVVTELVNMLKGYLPQPVNHNSTIADFIAKASADLTWLVRQTNGIWPEGDDLIAKDTIDGIGVVLSIAGELAAGWRWFTKAEYLARKAELQGKPSWDNAPEWAQYLVQNSIGLWIFTEFCVWPNNGGGWSARVGKCRRHCANAVDTREQGGGEVFGDWRDTMERRPTLLTIQQAGGAA